MASRLFGLFLLFSLCVGGALALLLYLPADQLSQPVFTLIYLGYFILSFGVIFLWGYYAIYAPLERIRDLLTSPLEALLTAEWQTAYGVATPLAHDIKGLLQAYQLKISQETQRAFRQGMFAEQSNIAQNISEALQPTITLSQKLEEKLFNSPIKDLEEIIAQNEHGLQSNAAFNLAKLKAMGLTFEHYLHDLREISFSLSKKIRRQQTTLRGKSASVTS